MSVMYRTCSVTPAHHRLHEDVVELKDLDASEVPFAAAVAFMPLPAPVVLQWSQSLAVRWR
jgi:hypothetical protein